MDLKYPMSYVKSKKEWVMGSFLWNSGNVSAWEGVDRFEGQQIYRWYISESNLWVHDAAKSNRFFTGFLTAQLMRAFTSILATVICLSYFHISFRMHISTC